MNIERVIVGPLDTNCYILKKDKYCLIIDPGDEIDKIKDKIGESQPIGVIITHHHFDHVGALEDLKNEYSLKSYDYFNMKEGINRIGQFKFEVIYTPGHKKDLISIYFKEEKVLFCGDFIFKDSIGRCDFSDSSLTEMQNSINKILSYPKDTTIFPGHGPNTVLKDEINRLNYFLET